METELKDIIAKNLSLLRVEKKMTQAEVAKELNYTDKSVSKWERGEVTPPVEVLKSLCELYGVSLDYITSDNSDAYEREKYSAKENKPNKIIITLLAVLTVWFAAVIGFVYGTFFDITDGWKFFIYACPVSNVVMIVLCSVWGIKKMIFINISFLIWTGILSVYVYFIEYNFWIFFIIGIPLQAATILWSQLKITHRKISK